MPESYAEQAQQREAMVFLQSYGVTPSLAVKIFKQYGDNTKQAIMQNPYRLVEDVEGVGFRTADRIAASLGRSKSRSVAGTTSSAPQGNVPSASATTRTRAKTRYFMADASPASQCFAVLYATPGREMPPPGALCFGANLFIMRKNR